MTERNARRSPPTPADFSAETESALLGEYWSRKNRGRSEQLAAAEAVTLVDCVGNDELAAGFQIACEVVPVRPFTDGETPEGTQQTPPVVGFLEWGTDGATESAEFDFVNGTVISAAGSSVRLRARYETPPAEPFPVVVRAHIGYFPKPASPAQRTVGGTVANGAQLALPIPKFSRRVRLVRAPLVSSTLELFRVFPALGAIAAYGPTVDPEIVLPIPNDARVIVITNAGAAPAEYRAIFDLWI